MPLEAYTIGRVSLHGWDILIASVCGNGKKGVGGYVCRKMKKNAQATNEEIIVLSDWQSEPITRAKIAPRRMDWMEVERSSENRVVQI